MPDALNGEVVELVQQYKIPILILTSREKGSINALFSELYVFDYIYKKSIKELEYVAKTIQTLYQNQQRAVLVVEDSNLYQNTLSQLLKNLNLPVFTASNGIEALLVMDEHPKIKLVITDYNMPEMDGLELIKVIRSKKNKDELGIIGLSSDNNRQTIVNFLKAGANDFMNKPPIKEELFCRVQNILNMISNINSTREMANTDFLTQINNRRQFFTAGQQLYNKSKREDSFMIVTLIDADHFKAINDTYGHDAGDKVLVNVANILKSVMPKEAIIARFGGEEFTAVCNLTDKQEAKVLLEKLRGKVESQCTIHNNQEIKVTISIGVNTAYGDSFQDMIARADEATYQAKALGRNQVVFYSSDE